MARFVLLHGFGGVGAGHWLVWLSEELRARGHVARLRKLPSPNAPDPVAWQAALGERLLRISSPDPQVRGERGDPSGELVVVAHSLGTLLWLRHAVRDAPAEVIADRAALIAPPQLPPHGPASAFTLELAGVRPELAARHTRLVVSSDDPWAPAGTGASAIGEPLGLPVDHLGPAGHVEPQDGFGPWPGLLAWCLGTQGEITR